MTKEKILQEFSDINHVYNNCTRYDTLKHMLDELTEQKTGHWIEKDGYGGVTYYDCSECGGSWTTIDGTPWNQGMQYCPNCGAKMESEDKK